MRLNARFSVFTCVGVVLCRAMQDTPFPLGESLKHVGLVTVPRA